MSYAAVFVEEEELEAEFQQWWDGISDARLSRAAFVAGWFAAANYGSSQGSVDY